MHCQRALRAVSMHCEVPTCTTNMHCEVPACTATCVFDSACVENLPVTSVLLDHVFGVGNGFVQPFPHNLGLGQLGARVLHWVARL